MKRYEGREHSKQKVSEKVPEEKNKCHLQGIGRPLWLELSRQRTMNEDLGLNSKRDKLSRV